MVGQLGFNQTVYEFDYFSGSQIGIYIGDVLVDDINSIQFHVQQGKTPIYGYGSQYWHTVADGQVLVNGAFTIPFKEADYLLLVLQRFYENKSPISKKDKEYQVLRENIERMMMNKEKTGAILSRDSHVSGILKSEEGSSYELQSTELFQRLAALPDQDFENAAEAFEDYLWQKDELYEGDDQYMTGNLAQGTTNNMNQATKMTYRRADQYPLFDIWILYGDIANKAANHTIKKIESVSIQSQGQVISADGETIHEQYNFIARNLV